MSKEQLSEHVIHIFKRCNTPGLHVCDLATGGGKSYTIGKLTCEYYPKYFDKIIILCVKKDLVTAMDKDIEPHITNERSLILKENKLVLRSNIENLYETRDSSAIHLIDEFEAVAYAEKDEKGHNAYLKIVKAMKENLANFSNVVNDLNNSSNMEQYNKINEVYFRGNIRKFIRTYKKIHKDMKNTMTYDFFMQKCPSLQKVYPQVRFSSPETKVVVMTVHKAMFGIDTLFFGNRGLTKNTDFKNTLFIFDESDQCALSMRSCIFTNAIQELNMSEQTKSVLKLYFYYLDILKKKVFMTDKETAKLQKSVFKEAKMITDKIWKQEYGTHGRYSDIYTSSPDKVNEFVKGIFFSGMNINVFIRPDGKKIKSYIGYKKGDTNLTMDFNEQKTALEKYDVCNNEKIFISMLLKSIKAIKSRLCEIVIKSYNKKILEADKDIRLIAENKDRIKKELNLPRIEDVVHTIVERLNVIDSDFLEKQLMEHLTNRKNFKDKNKKVIDESLYAQGFSYFENVMDERDYDRGIHISYKQITTTPEKILVDLLDDKLGNSIVLCSATANNKSVVSNFDFNYVKQCLTSKIDYLTHEDYETFDSLVKETYPANHEITVNPILAFQYEKDATTEELLKIPDHYRKMFCQEALDMNLPQTVIGYIIKQFLDAKKKNDRNLNDLKYELCKLWRFVETYWNFYTNKDIHTMIYFQNQLGKKNKDKYTVLACLIDGTFKRQIDAGNMEIYYKIPSTWENDTLIFTNKYEEQQKEVDKKLEKNAKAKVMLVAAYNSFKAGANLQYSIPKGIPCLYGDDWNMNKSTKKKDWDSIYLDLPTSYLSQNEDDITSFYNILLTLSMFESRAYMTEREVANWIYRAKSGNFLFSEKTCPTILPDKAAWMQTILEQAVGRISRTKNKTPMTYIFYDERICPYISLFDTDKSLSPEFRELITVLQEESNGTTMLDNMEIDKILRENNHQQALKNLRNIRSNALKYVPKPGGGYDFWEEQKDMDVPYYIQQAQVKNEAFKQTIIKHPVISSLDELTNEDKLFPEIGLCYSIYDSKEYFNCPSKKKLDILMQNDIIRDYFISHGFATDWKKDGLILHPEILNAEYAGEVGEQAFKALVLYYTGWEESRLAHLTGKLYEYADFVTQKKNGEYGIAIDVKNRHPKDIMLDSPNDLPFVEKKDIKEERLGCNLLLVNMLKIERNPLDDAQIPGLIDDNGKVIGKNMNLLLRLLNAK